MIGESGVVRRANTNPDDTDERRYSYFLCTGGETSATDNYEIQMMSTTSKPRTYDGDETKLTFVTFNKKTSSSPEGESRKLIDEIFDDGRTTPIRPVRRKERRTPRGTTASALEDNDDDDDDDDDGGDGGDIIVRNLLACTSASGGSPPPNYHRYQREENTALVDCIASGTPPNTDNASTFIRRSSVAASYRFDIPNDSAELQNECEKCAQCCFDDSCVCAESYSGSYRCDSFEDSFASSSENSLADDLESAHSRRRLCLVRKGRDGASSSGNESSPILSISSSSSNSTSSNSSSSSDSDSSDENFYEVWSCECQGDFHRRCCTAGTMWDAVQIKERVGHKMTSKSDSKWVMGTDDHDAVCVVDVQPPGHELSDEAPSRYATGDNPVVDDLFKLRWARQNGDGDLTDVECWLENMYFRGYESEEDSVVGMESKWFSSNDNEGRVYYFAENSNESSWTLPTVTTSSSEKMEEQIESLTENRIYSNLPSLTRSATGVLTPNENTQSLEDVSQINRIVKSKSMILVDKNEESTVSFPMKNWPQLSDGRMCILKEGTLNKTKITENGKRVRKNWSTSHVVLTELFLLFYKDAKSFNAMQKPGAAGRPEMSVDLNGALIDRGDRVSSRKNVYMISTVLGLQVLIQNDCVQQADNWLLAIQSAIKNLPSAFDSFSRFPINTEESMPDPESKKLYKVTRSKSIKAKNKDGSIEDLTVNPAERQTKIKARLKKFFNRRPTMEALVKKGIYKDEPAFGCYLEHVVTNESPKVPLFVQRCINCIESSEENMKTDGLYRASGNLSQVQKIRLQVDQNNLSVIEDEEDVHVLTGALKLFFRELKEPLIPYHLFHKAIKASHNNHKKEKISQFREITRALPTANYDTLKFLLQHLLKVVKYKEYNRMHIPNLAIVFGPTLMWSEQESSNMALDLMQQNLVIECLLVDYESIFR